MELPNDIVLRPRFTLEYDVLPETMLCAYEDVGAISKDFVVYRADDHIFISIQKKKNSISGLHNYILKSIK